MSQAKNMEGYHYDVEAHPLGEAVELSRGFRRDDQIKVEIERLNAKGQGVSLVRALVGPQREEKHYTVTIAHALPGEVIVARVDRTRKRDVSAKRVEILRESEARVEPPCPHFGPLDLEREQGCGGCTLQSLTYATQLDYKQRAIERALSALPDVLPRVRPILGCESPFFYRNKMEFSFGDHAKSPWTIGLHPGGRRYDVLALSSCHLLSAWVEALLPKLAIWCQAHGLEPYKHKRHEGFLRQLMLREGKRTGERLVELMTSSCDEAMIDGQAMSARDVAELVCAEIASISHEAGFPIDTIYWTQHHVKKGERSRQIEEVMRGSGVLHERLHIDDSFEPLSFAIHPRAFFQPNTLQAERLYRETLRAADLLEPEVERDLIALDLYCGTGTIALCMAKASPGARVLGIELSEEAVENARQNARRNALQGVEFFAGDVADVIRQEAFAQALGERGEVDLVVVDPPRAGLMPQALAHIQEIGAARLVYVSCNPRSLARDLERLLDETSYVLDYIQPVDMFPQTMHVENVARLVKRS